MARLAGLHLTPEILEAAYNYLRSTPPYRRWKLPHADEVRFQVTWKTDQRGNCQQHGNGKHTVRISQVFIGRTVSLMEAMAHEMVHVHLDRKKVRAHHGNEFQTCAEQVCRYHGFDFRQF